MVGCYESLLTTVPPQVVILAGAHGAGRTTAASYLLPHELELVDYVNADWIARGLCGFAPHTAAIAAGRLMWERLKGMAARRCSFGFETTLAGRALAVWLAGLKSAGYRISLIYLTTSSPEVNVARLAGNGNRDEILRSYALSRRNFERLYRPLADAWRIYDTSAVPSLVDAERGTPCVSLIGERFRLGSGLDRAMEEAVRRAMVIHKKLGNRVAVARHGRLRQIPAERFLLDFRPTESGPITSA